MDKQAFADGYMAKSAGEFGDTAAILGDQAKGAVKKGLAGAKKGLGKYVEHHTNKRVPNEAYTNPGPVQSLAQSFYPEGNIGKASTSYPGRVSTGEATPEVDYGVAGGLAGAKANIAASRAEADDKAGFHPMLRAVQQRIRERRAAAGK
jgi:hypothetical protein